MTRIAFALVFLCVACRGEGGTAPAPEAAETPPTEVAALRWVPVSAPQDASLLEAPAVVRAAAGASGEVSSSYRAHVERVHTQVGSRVERGDPIVDVLAPEVFEAAAAYVGSKRRLELHAERAEELERLRAEGLVEKSRVFEQRMLAAELQARRDEARAVLRAAGVNPQTADALARGGALTLRAPVGGIVVELDAQPGEIREAAAGPLARIRGEGSARVEVRTPGPWPAGDRAVLELTDGREIPLRGEPVAGVIDPDAGTHVHWLVPEEDRPLPDGLRGVVRLAAGAGLWEVPAGAVLQQGTTSTVLRRRVGGVAQVEVVVAVSSGASALVRGPLQEGDEVAADPPRGGSPP